MKQQGVTIGRRLGNGFGRDDAIGAQAILHDDALAQLFTQLPAEQAGRQVRTAAGGKRYQQPDRPVRVVGLGGGQSGQRRCQHERQRISASWHCGFLFC